ncbi:MAG: glycosyltransferase family 2 protein [Candidatus Daviesbacteria bacterium]|nr:glycosyltransferase family 2 protein [Candidatus Daviesbacteria bacterium]
MLFHKKVSIVIPCRNEEVALASLLQKIPSYIDEVIVVDNKSTDQTYKVAKSHGARVFIENRTNGGIGYGFAHQTGLKKATGDYIVAMDGDDTYPVHSIKKVISVMEKKNLDFVSCSRQPLKDQSAITPTRRMGIKILNLMIFLLYGFYFKDILTGMWVMNKKSASQLNLVSGDWDLSPEIKLAALTNKNLKFSEMHVPYFMRKGESKLNIWRTGFKHVLFIFRYRFNLVSKESIVVVGEAVTA